MSLRQTLLASALASLAITPALAQGNPTEIVQRNINQQQRIEQGLQSGALNTREAARLQHEEARVEQMQSRALRDGKLTAEESARINRAQDAVSRDIHREKHDAQVGNPNSASSQRLQTDVQRNINQQTRIRDGLQSGTLTNREAGRLEAGQAHTNRMQARAGAGGHVGAHEQRHIHRAENAQSRHIYQQKHDGQHHR